MRQIIRGIFFVLVLLVISLSGTSAQEPNETLALNVIAQINAWRISEGTWPLRPNATLQAMALDQARYLAGLPDLPDDMHRNISGLNPRERAVVAPYHWPSYKLISQVAVGENAGVGTVNSVMRFWRASNIHTRATLNNGYREIGVAAVPYRGQHLFIVVLGSRPNVLPALADPTQANAVYLTSERYAYAGQLDAIQRVTQLTLFDTDGRPLTTEPLAWPANGLVSTANNAIGYVLFSDGTHTAVSAVEPAILPGYLPQTIPATPTAVPTIPAASISTATATPSLSATAVPATGRATATPLQPTATLPPPTATIASMPDLLITYNQNTLNVLNVSGQAQDWSALSFEGTITFPFVQWARVVDMPVSAMPADHCAQIRDVALSGGVSVPDGCRWVRSMIQINTERMFWTQGAFDVRLNDQTLATCQPNAGTCTVSLP